MIANSVRTTASFPALASLRLDKEHLVALAKQGSLRAEGGSPGKRYYKLRFRVGVQQHARYVGNNPQFVEQVAQELRRLQSRTRSCRNLRRLVQEANARLHRSKQQLKLLLPLAGRCFYGREIR